jgi:hypothetical protein
MTLRVNETVIVDSNRNLIDLGNGTSTGNSHIRLPNGTTVERPLSPVNGMIRYNTTISDFEGYLNGSWQLLTPEAQLSTSGPVKVSSVIKSSIQSTTSRTLVPVTDLSITITPTTTASKIRVQAAVNTSTLAAIGYCTANVSIVKNDTTELARGILTGLHSPNSTGPTATYQYSSVIHLEFVDSPATTSAVKYSVYFAAGSANATYAEALVSNAVINSTTVSAPKSEMIVEEYIY